MRRTVAPLAALALVSLVLTGCSSSAGTKEENGDERVSVIASFYPLAFIAEQVGGNSISVVNLTKAGVEPHDLELTPSQVASLSSTDLLFYIKGFNPAMDKAVAQSTIKNVVDVSSLEELPSPEAEITGNDPHIWQDPAKYSEMASRFEKVLAEIDPAHSQKYAANLATFKGALFDLDTEFRAGLATCERKEIITSHSAFGYLAKRYHLIQVGILGLSPDAEPSPKRLNEIAKQVRRDKITTIFFESLLSPKVAKTLASDLKIKAEVLDPIEGVGENQTYFSVMESNLVALRKALNCS
ncbi:MAG: metal ABC transporter substrate-binding protein [Actinomycetota bacterium]